MNDLLRTNRFHGNGRVIEITLRYTGGGYMVDVVEHRGSAVAVWLSELYYTLKDAMAFCDAYTKDGGSHACCD